MNETVVITHTVPDWLAEMRFCHIDDGSGERAYCLHPDGGGPITCDDEYTGNAICASCGLSTCPRCAQLSALDDGLLMERGEDEAPRRDYGGV